MNPNVFDKDGLELKEDDVVLFDDTKAIIVTYANRHWNVYKNLEQRYRKIGHLYVKRKEVGDCYGVPFFFVLGCVISISPFCKKIILYTSDIFGQQSEQIAVWTFRYLFGFILSQHAQVIEFCFTSVNVFISI